MIVASAATAVTAAAAAAPWMVPTAGGAEQLDASMSQLASRLLFVLTGSCIIHGWTATLIQTTTTTPIHESASAIANAVQLTVRPANWRHNHAQSMCQFYAQHQLATSSFISNV